MSTMILYKKMIEEAMAAQRADVDTVAKKRGGPFVVADAKAYLTAVRKMKPIDTQSAAVFRLHTDSVKAHFSVLEKLTKRYGRRMTRSSNTTRPRWSWRSSSRKTRRSKKASRPSQTPSEGGSTRRQGSRPQVLGFYGPTCVVDFALIPGSTSNVVNQILKTTDIPLAHKQAILASKSWAMNTSYGSGMCSPTKWRRVRPWRMRLRQRSG